MIHPEEVAGILEKLKGYVTEACEVQLADWQENPNSGAWVKFRLPDEKHLEIYRGKYRAGRTKGFGQRYHMILIEIGDDEHPIGAEPEHKPRKLSSIAGLLCNDPNFRAWASHTYGEPCPDAEAAAVMVREVCGIQSRAELDTSEGAAIIFRELLGDYDRAKREAG